MRMYDIIRKKRDGFPLSEGEIRYFTEGYVKGEIPDYQAAALCMAIYFKGMDPEEITALTFAVRDSGEKLDFSQIKGIRADKHSTGGVGDKTSLVVGPIVASCGLTVAKISGRGLGHTGGTIDKLESIPGFRTDLPEKTFIDIVNRTGLAIVGQSRDIAPADKKLYALRDVTATVDSIPLIVSSIMGKKLAADDDVIVLDVKSGSGSFNKTLEDSETLAKIMVDIGKRAGKKIKALITDMDLPLGSAVGNALEVMEAIETLKGRGPEDFTELCVTLAANMLSLGGKGSPAQCEAMVRKAILDGSALQRFRMMVESQGGDPAVTEDYALFGEAPFCHQVKAPETGYIYQMDTEGIGKASLLLGAGRNTMEDTIDMTAGIMIRKKTGDYVQAGETLAVLYTSDMRKVAAAEEEYVLSNHFSKEAPERRPLVLNVIE